MTFVVTDWPSRHSDIGVAASCPSFVNLALLQSPAFARAGISDLLSWDSPWRALFRRGPPDRPSIDVSAERPLPYDVAIAFRVRSCRFELRSVLVVFRHLDGFLRSEVAGLLHPAADPGVRCVSSTTRHLCTEMPDGRPVLSPQTLFVPPEEFPSSIAAPCHHGRYPLAVLPRSARRIHPHPLPDTSLFVEFTKIVDFEALLCR